MPALNGVKEKIQEPGSGRAGVMNATWRSIKVRMTLYVLGILMAVIWTMTILIGAMLQEDMRRQLGEQQFSTATLVAQSVDNGLREQINSLEQYAKGRIVPSMLNDAAALQERLEGSPAILSIFNEGIFVTGVDGIAMASAPMRSRVGTSYIDRDFIVAAVREGRSSIGKPVIGKLLGSPVLAIAIPLRNTQGEVIGALAGVTNLGAPNFLDKIAQNRYGNSGGYALVAPQHRLIVTATDRNLIMQPVPEPGVDVMVDRYMQGYEGFGVTVNSRGVGELSSARAIPVAGWFVLVALPVEEAFASIDIMKKRLLLSSLFFSVLAGALTWWLVARNLQRRFSPMLEASRALSVLPVSDQPIPALPVSSRDEVGELIGGFNRLLEVLNQREESLRRSESRLASILDETKIHLWVFDGNRFTFVNKQWFDFTGQNPGDGLTLELWNAVVHPDDLPRATAVWNENWLARTEHDNHFRLRRHDGVYRDFYCHTLPVLDAQGVFQSFYGFNLDVTERKRMEEELDNYRLHLENLVEQRTAALRDAEEKYRTVADFTYDWETWIDDTGRWLYCSPACERVTGYPAEQFMTRPALYLDIAHPDDRSRLLFHLQEAERQGTCSIEYRIRHRNGETRWIEHLCRPVKDASGKSLGRRVSNRDVTERRWTNDMLRKAREEAESASLAKSTFLANMSHEIRTPLNGIIGMTHILRRGVVNPNQADHLEKIGAAAEHLLSIINDILDLSKIEAGKIVLEAVPVVVNSLLVNVRSIMAARARAKGLDLRIETEAFPTNLQGDPTRLQQALLNYVSNAIKFTEAGSVTLRGWIVEEDDCSVRIRFEVQDSGVGIAAESLPRLFQAFEQADASTSRRYGGTGLGLAITRRLAELMGGKAGVESVPGFGSTFWFTARLAKGMVRKTLIQSDFSEAERVLRENHAGQRILIVDDEPLNLEIARYLLTDLGLSVDVAEDGEIAISKARKTAYAVVLMDMQMPRLDGIETTKLLRELVGYEETPILALTANAFAEDRARCFAAGMNDFVAKPFSPEVLYSVLLRWLEKEHSLR